MVGVFDIQTRFSFLSRITRSSFVNFIEIAKELLNPKSSLKDSCPLYNDLYDFVLSKLKPRFKWDDSI
jgi:hypothetical protein